MPSTLFIGGHQEFIRECKKAASSVKMQVVGEAVSPSDLYLLVDRVHPDALLLPSEQGWTNAAVDLTKVRPNMMVFVSGPITRETWDRLSDNRVLVVSGDPEKALSNVANAMSRLAPNKFRFEERSIMPPDIATQRKVVAVPSKIITVHSPKGGVGKTTVAENLAAVLGLWARKQERDTGSPCRVALLDASMDGSTGIYTWNLHTKPKTVLLWDEFLTDRDVTDLRWQDVSTAMNYSEAANVWYLAPPLLPEEKERFGTKLLQNIIAGCQRFFHFTVIDTGVGLIERDVTISAMMGATDVLLISDLKYKTLELLIRAYKYEIRRMIKDPTKFGLVLNRVEKTWFTTKDLLTEFARETGEAISLKGELPEEPAMKRKESETMGVPFSCVFPGSPFTKSLLSLCNNVVGAEIGGLGLKSRRKLFPFRS